MCGVPVPFIAYVNVNQIMGGSPGELSEELVTQETRKKVWRMNCDVGEVTEKLENELCYDCNYELCSFSNPSVASPTSQLILQPFFRLSYVNWRAAHESVLFCVICNKNIIKIIPFQARKLF